MNDRLKDYLASEIIWVKALMELFSEFYHFLLYFIFTIQLLSYLIIFNQFSNENVNPVYIGNDSTDKLVF